MNTTQHRQVKGQGKLPVYLIEEIHPGTILFKSDGTSGEMIHMVDRKGYDEHRVFTRILWQGETEETQRSYLATTTFAVDSESFEQAKTDYKHRIKRQEKANALKGKSLNMYCAQEYFEQHCHNLEILAIETEHPGYLQNRITAFKAQKEVLERIANWFHDHQHGHERINWGGIARSLHKIGEEIQRNLNDMQPAKVRELDEENKKAVLNLLTKNTTS